MIKGLVVAFQFLSRIPIPISVEFNTKNLKIAKFFFPLVGVVLGGLVGGLVYFLMGYSIEVAALLGVVLNIVLTGGLHIDGLSDMCDGFFSNKDKDRIIEIMHDSRVGSFGVLSTVLLILWKFIMYKSLGEYTFLFILLAGMFSRMSVQYMISMKKLAVPSGMGSMIRGENSLGLVVFTFLFYGVITAFINPIYLIPLLLNMVLVEIISRFSYRKIGGVSGDIYGATVELSEAFNLLCFWGDNTMDIILMRHGETEDNLSSVFSSDDTPLTPDGVRQVRENAALLKGMKIDEILVSPLRRAIETFEIVREYVDAPYRIYDGIKEIESGIIKGLTFDQAIKKYPSEMDAWFKDMYEYRLEGGESYVDVYERAKRVFSELREDNKVKLLITHSGFINIALAYTLGDIKYSSTFKIDYGSITGVTFGNPNRIIYANNFVRESTR